MAKAPKTIYQCSECGGTSPKWQGKCPHCGEWNTLQESLAAPEPKNARFQSWAADTSTVQSLSAVTATEVPRNPTGMGELDRVLGGGLVDGAVILLGGDPGIGKSTLLLQTIAKMAQSRKVAVRFRRGIRPTGRPARATFGTAHRRRKPACRNPHGSDSDGLETASARSRCHRLHPNHVFRPNHLRPRFRVASTRMCRPTNAYGETDGHRHDTGRTRYQRRRDCRPARAGAYGRYRAVFRGRPTF